jgi:hypothetical protein
MPNSLGPEGVIPHPLPEVNFYQFAAQKVNNPYENLESIRDATAELQVKIILSCFINK